MTVFDWYYRSSIPGLEWTPRDETLLRTASILEAIASDRFGTIDALLVPFAVDGQWPDNKIIAMAPFVLHSYQGQGDASYMHDNGFFFATGGAGLALTAGVGIARAVGNSRRRRAAEQAAMAGWRTIDSGQAYANQYGFYFSTGHQLHFWNWESIQIGEMIARGQFSMIGQSVQGPVHYCVESDIAELLFALWALARQPQHPQFLQRIWILPEWWEKVQVLRRAMASDGFDPTGQLPGA